MDTTLDIALVLVVGYLASMALLGIFYGVYRIGLCIARRAQAWRFARRRWPIVRGED
jgi:hypothetical protein